MIKASKQESTFELTPAGNHIARVYRVIHIGTAPEMYMGEEKVTNKIMIGFELCNKKKVFKEGGVEEPYTINKEFTLSMGSKSNLRKFIEGMYGIALQDEEAYAFDISSLIGEPLLLNVIHTISKKGKEYADVKGASPIPEGLTVPEMYNTAQSLDYENFNEKIFESLSNFIKDKITKTDEFKKMRGTIDDTEIPF